MRNYIVMSANKEVAEFCGGELNILDKLLAPLYLKRTKNFEQWVADRAIDATRPNSRVMKKIHGLSRMSPDFETAMKYNAACITDNFWVKKDANETWEDVKFDNDIYFRAAVSSDISVYDEKPSRTPELTNIGSREKGWKLAGGAWWLYKNEPELNMKFELLASKIGELLGFDMAYYELADGFICTKDITEGKYNLQHIDAIVYDHDGVNEENLLYNYKTLYEIKPELARQYADIKYLDALVNNVDRHTKNYGVLTSQEDGSIIKLAPNYDNDMAFYGYPDILHGDRERGEIKEFKELASVIDYEPPALTEESLLELTASFEDGELIAKYVLDAQNILR